MEVDKNISAISISKEITSEVLSVCYHGEHLAEYDVRFHKFIQTPSGLIKSK